MLQNTNNISELKSNFSFKKDKGEKTKLQIRKSDIHGKGLFTMNSILKGIVLVPVMKVDKDGNVTHYSEPQKYINHSINNNVIPVKYKNVIYFVSINNIEPNEEILANYSDINDLGVKADLLEFLNYSTEDNDELLKISRGKTPENNRPEGHIYSI